MSSKMWEEITDQFPNLDWKDFKNLGHLNVNEY